MGILFPAHPLQVHARGPSGLNKWYQAILINNWSQAPTTPLFFFFFLFFCFFLSFILYHGCLCTSYEFKIASDASFWHILVYGCFLAACAGHLHVVYVCIRLVQLNDFFVGMSRELGDHGRVFSCLALPVPERHF